MSCSRISLMVLIALLLVGVGETAHARIERELVDSVREHTSANGRVVVAHDGFQLVVITRHAGVVAVDLFHDELDGHPSYTAVVEAPPTTSFEPIGLYVQIEGDTDEQFAGGRLQVLHDRQEMPHCGHLRAKADPDPCIFGSGRSYEGIFMLSLHGSSDGTFVFQSVPSRCPTLQIPRAAFDDTNPHVHQEAISCLVWLGLAHGVDDMHFAPDRHVTRGQMAAFLHRFLDWTDVDVPAGVSAGFSDVGPRTTHREAIHQLAGMGIVNGRNDGSFQPGAPVSRAQTASMAVAVLEYVMAGELERPEVAFDDVEGVHADNIRKAAGAGLLRGTSTTTFGPGQDTSRGQMASTLARMLDVLIEY